MDVSRVQRHQEIMASQSLDSMLVCTKPQNQQQQQQQQQEKKPRPTEEALKCPRCDSSNTKFCYYNNYSLTQPRYFCKSCRRYWTKGGTLRNVPVGGGCRKNKRCSRRSTPDHLQSSFITSPTSSTSQHHQLVSPFGSFEHCYSSGIASLGNNFDLFGGNANNHQYYGGGYLGGGAEHYDLLQLHHHNENNNNVVSSSSGSLLTPTIKQELGGGDNNNNSHHNRALLSYIMGGGVNGGVGEIDAHRESWNAGVLGSSTTWHNLINSPLM